MGEAEVAEASHGEPVDAVVFHRGRDLKAVGVDVHCLSDCGWVSRQVDTLLPGDGFGVEAGDDEECERDDCVDAYRFERGAAGLLEQEQQRKHGQHGGFGEEADE